MTDGELSVFIGEALDKRMKYYSKAAHTFPADRLETAEQIDETVRLFIDRFLTNDINCLQQ